MMTFRHKSLYTSVDPILMSHYAPRFSLGLYCIKRCFKISLIKIQIYIQILIEHFLI